METRALRPWELFDEGLVAFQGFLSQAAVAGQLSYVAIDGAPIARAQPTDLIVITKIVPIQSAGLPTIRLNQSTAQVASGTVFNVDYRVASPPVALDQVTTVRGSAAAATGSLVGEVVTGTVLECFYALTPSAAVAPPTPNVAVWGSVLNAVLDVTFEGLYIPTTR